MKSEDGVLDGIIENSTKVSVTSTLKNLPKCPIIGGNERTSLSTSQNQKPETQISESTTNPD